MLLIIDFFSREKNSRLPIRATASDGSNVVLVLIVKGLRDGCDSIMDPCINHRCPE